MGGYKTGGGREVKFYLYETGGGGGEVVAMLKRGGGRTSFGVVFSWKF